MQIQLRTHLLQRIESPPHALPCELRPAIIFFQFFFLLLGYRRAVTQKSHVMHRWVLDPCVSKHLEFWLLGLQKPTISQECRGQ